MPDAIAWWKDRVAELSGKMGPGLLGKVGPVFIAILLASVVAMFQLPTDQKLFGFYLALGAAVAYAILATFVVVAQPILGNMDGRDALRYLREDIKAKNPAVITGTSRPVANKAPSMGISQEKAP